jgi:hypothetical protein
LGSGELVSPTGSALSSPHVHPRTIAKIDAATAMPFADALLANRAKHELLFLAQHVLASLGSKTRSTEHLIVAVGLIGGSASHKAREVIGRGRGAG